MSKKSGDGVTIAAGVTSGDTYTIDDTFTFTVNGMLSTTTGSTPTVTFAGGTDTLVNSGTIVSTVDRALYAKNLSSGSKITVTNNSGAKILSSTSSSNNDAFKINGDFSGGSVTINNSGYIVAGSLDSSNIVLASGATTSGQALDFADNINSLITINNNSGGVIGSADSDGIRAGDNSVINNHGKIIGQNGSSSSTGNDGIDYQTSTSLTTGSATVNNYSDGSIIGARHGITAKFAITVNNAGTITGQLGSGINLDNTSGTTVVVNTGTISGTSGGTTDGDGIDIDYILQLDNYGSIQAYGTSTGSLSEAVTIGGGTINNYAGGVIQSVQRAITVDDSNDGNAPAATTIYNEGSIIGGNGEAISITDTFADTVTNKGIITGSVSLGGGADVYNDYTGSTQTGQIDGGTGSDTLNLLGSGSGTFGSVVNFETLDVQAGTWSLSDDETFSSGTTIASGATLQIGAGGATGTLSGAIDDEGTLIFDRTGTLTVSSAISGAGAVIQSGTGTTVLSAQNSYSGGTTIESGTLDVSALTGAGTGAITFGSGSQTLKIETAALSNGSFTNIIKGFAAGDVIDLANSDATTATLGANNVLTISGGTTGTVTIQLDPNESFSGEYFHLASDDNNGLYITESSQPCYCPGTLILTDRGERPVEDLVIGDILVTASGEHRPIKWIGRRAYAGRYILGKADILPVCIKAGALADNLPCRDLWISPHHAMFLEDVLIEARDLVNGVSIVQAETVDQVEYFHLELATHDLILAEGAVSETFIDDDSRMMFHNAHEYAALYPNKPLVPAQYCAPRRSDGYEVEAARRHIAARAGLALSDTTPVKVRGSVDRAGPDVVAGWVQIADRPDAVLCVDVLAGGRVIGTVLANRYRADLAAANIGHGRHAFELRLPASIEPAAIEVRCSLSGTRLPRSRAAAEPAPERTAA